MWYHEIPWAKLNSVGVRSVFDKKVARPIGAHPIIAVSTHVN